jgi:predicted metal-dependent hydrolase
MLDPRNIIRTDKHTISLLVNAKGELIVRAPYYCSEYEIFNFVKQKADWIEKKQHSIRSNSYININVLNYNSYLFLGKELTPVISSKVNDFNIDNGTIYIPSKIQSDKILSKIERWFKKLAADVITKRAEFFSARLRLVPQSIAVNNNKTRWGVCDIKSNIAINWRAIFLPPNLLDYIIVHEFCHLLEFNHTKNFWAVVEQIVPDWRTVRLHLKHLNYLLLLFRKE